MNADAKILNKILANNTTIYIKIINHDPGKGNESKDKQTGPDQT